MKDRIVEHPNRYRMVKTDQADVVDLIPEPGEITEVGTPINKATLLIDEVAELYGNVETVNEALESVTNGANQCVVFFDACYPGTREPVTGAYSFSVTGTGVSITFTTDGSKRRTPIVLVPGSYSVKMTSKAVIPFDNSAISFTVTFGDNHKTIFLFSAKPSVTLFASSGAYKVDAKMIQTLKKEIDVSVVGGGAGGADFGGGGGGGYVTSESIGKEVFTSDTIVVTVGSGGGEGIGGGTSRVQIGSKTIHANGGQPGEHFSGGATGRGGDGGSGGGAFNANGGSYGGDGLNGKNGTYALYGGVGQGNTYLFKATGAGTFAVSGGGGGAGYYNGPAPQGGRPGGGNGGNGTVGGNGSDYGAGGGSGSLNNAGRPMSAGTGYAGLVAIRING